MHNAMCMGSERVKTYFSGTIAKSCGTIYGHILYIYYTFITILICPLLYSFIFRTFSNGTNL